MVAVIIHNYKFDFKIYIKQYNTFDPQKYLKRKPSIDFNCVIGKITIVIHDCL